MAPLHRGHYHCQVVWLKLNICYGNFGCGRIIMKHGETPEGCKMSEMHKLHASFMADASCGSFPK